MEIVVRLKSLATDGGQVREWASLLQRTLSRFEKSLSKVVLYMSDVNGPRGGIDKECRCLVHFHRLPPVIIHDRHEKAGPLVQRVAARAAQAVATRFETRRERRIRRSPANPLS